MNRIVKGLIRFLIEVIVIMVLIVGIGIFTDGMYLLGLPDLDDIQSVNISYPSVTDEGADKTISANNTTVWWNNKTYAIKDEEMFISLTEGIFFLEDLQTK